MIADSELHSAVSFLSQRSAGLFRLLSPESAAEEREKRLIRVRQGKVKARERC